MPSSQVLMPRCLAAPLLTNSNRNIQRWHQLAMPRSSTARRGAVSIGGAIMCGRLYCDSV